MIPDLARDHLARVAVGQAVAEPLVLGLFANNVVPTRYDDVSNYVEPVGGGYAPVVLGEDWSVLRGMATHPPVMWTFSEAVGLVHGWLLRTAYSGILIAAERFVDGPYPITSSGSDITVAARLRFGDLVPA